MLKVEVKDACCYVERDGTVLEMATECAVAVRGMCDVISKYSPALGHWFKGIVQKEQFYAVENGPDSMLEIEDLEVEADVC